MKKMSTPYNKKQTFGSQVLEHRAKNLTMDDDVIEYRRAMEHDIIGMVNNAATEAKNHTLYANKDFYVVLLILKERFADTPNFKVFARQSCPTPTYKQSVWKYHHHTSTIEFLWCIPDGVLYHHILANPRKYLEDKETNLIAQTVIQMETGQLLTKVKKENGEKIDVVIKNHKEGDLDGRKLIIAS